jgi:hypothetical protein
MNNRAISRISGLGISPGSVMVIRLHHVYLAVRRHRVGQVDAVVDLFAVDEHHHVLP